jgi:very-short-patch-repair endonuclease
MARKRSSGERAFLHWWGLLAEMPPPPEEEFHFAKSIGRNWRFDFAWPEQKTSVEIDGGEWLYKTGKKSRHMTGTGYQGDIEKLNIAVILGWRVLRYTPSMLAANPSKCIEQIKQVLGQESESE